MLHRRVIDSVADVFEHGYGSVEGGEGGGGDEMGY